jgi:hypothetical protein
VPKERGDDVRVPLPGRNVKRSLSVHVDRVHVLAQSDKHRGDRLCVAALRRGEELLRERQERGFRHGAAEQRVGELRLHLLLCRDARAPGNIWRRPGWRRKHLPYSFLRVIDLLSLESLGISRDLPISPTFTGF